MSHSHWAILKGSNSQHFLTQRKSRIGRDTNCNDVILLSQSISKKQCVINATDINNIVITDMNSRNGTFVNNQLYKDSTIKIKHGDIVRFGFDANCYRLELTHKPTITRPPPQQHRFDDLRREDRNNPINDNLNPHNLSRTAPSHLNQSNALNQTMERHPVSAPNTRCYPQSQSQTQRSRRSAGFMIGSPPMSPSKFDKINEENEDIQSNKTIEDEKEMKFLKNSLMRLETKINKISKENHKNQSDLSKQLKMLSPKKQKQKSQQTEHKFVTLINKECEYKKERESEKINAEKMEKIKKMQKEQNEQKMQKFYESVERLSVDKALEMLNMKIQFLCHLFQNVDDFNHSIPNFCDFSSRFKQQKTQKSKENNKTSPKCKDFLKLLEYLNDILDANQCSQIAQFIENVQSEILIHRNEENKTRQISHSRSIQVNDTERDNVIAVAHSMKEYSNNLQIRLYQLRQIMIDKDEQIQELNKKDWVKQLESYKNTNCSLNRQILIQEKDNKRLYKMFSELTQKIDRNLPDSSILRAKINDFIQSYNTKIFHLTSKLSEVNRRKNEKCKKWNEQNEKCRRYMTKIKNLENTIKCQRASFQKTLQQKDLALLKSNKQLSVLAAMHGSNDQEKAAKFLFETLQKYISENDAYKLSTESLETSLQIKTQQIQSLEEAHQIAMDSMGKNENVQMLQQELREEREHFGAERITKLEKMLFDLQTTLALKTEVLEKVKDENRKLSETAPMNEVETIEFLSKSIYDKDEHINKLQRMIDSQKLKISELSLIEETLRNQTSKHQDEIEHMQQKHQRVNNILGTMKIKSMHPTNVEMETLQTAETLFRSSSQNDILRHSYDRNHDNHGSGKKWDEEIVDHDIDVSIDDDSLIS